MVGPWPTACQVSTGALHTHPQHLHHGKGAFYLSLPTVFSSGPYPPSLPVLSPLPPPPCQLFGSFPFFSSIAGRQGTAERTHPRGGGCKVPTAGYSPIPSSSLPPLPPFMMPPAFTEETNILDDATLQYVTNLLASLDDDMPPRLLGDDSFESDDDLIDSALKNALADVKPGTKEVKETRKCSDHGRKRHLEYLDELADGTFRCKEEHQCKPPRYQQNLDKSEGDFKEEKKKTQQYYCSDCGVVLNSLKQAEIHYGGGRHQHKVADLEAYNRRKGIPYVPSKPIPYDGEKAGKNTATPSTPPSPHTVGSLNTSFSDCASTTAPRLPQVDGKTSSATSSPSLPRIPAASAPHPIPLPLTPSLQYNNGIPIMFVPVVVPGWAASSSPAVSAPTVTADL
eukprot:Sspe_Gene.7491::Locus_2537_Transcript_1_2_Confidence_0.667_Length_1370::g.7491::m.7491